VQEGIVVLYFSFFAAFFAAWGKIFYDKNDLRFFFGTLSIQKFVCSTM
jgi:hypothetical protein